MLTGLEQRITARIAALKTARDQFLQEANQRLVGFSTAISEFELLLAPQVEAVGEQAKKRTTQAGPAPGAAKQPADSPEQSPAQAEDQKQGVSKWQNQSTT